MASGTAARSRPGEQDAGTAPVEQPDCGDALLDVGLDVEVDRPLGERAV